MVTKWHDTLKDQSGSALIIVLVVLMAITALSIMAIRSGTTELEVATNDKFRKMVFSAADGANEMTTELIDQNILKRGFSGPTYGGLQVPSLDFYINEENTVDPDLNQPSDTNFDIQAPSLGDASVFLKVYGSTTKPAEGAGLEMASGYDGIGKSAAGGGVITMYDIRSLAQGPSNSQARIWLRWRQVF